MKLMRVEFEAPDGWAPQCNFTIDMILGNENRPRSGVPFCGWWGRLDSKDVLMFVVLKDGRVDFGGDPETVREDRYGKINFHGRKIEPGELVTYFDETDWPEGLLLRVGRMIDLLEHIAQD